MILDLKWFHEPSSKDKFFFEREWEKVLLHVNKRIWIKKKINKWKQMIPTWISFVYSHSKQKKKKILTLGLVWCLIITRAFARIKNETFNCSPTVHS